jgi:hypothetical protein
VPTRRIFRFVPVDVGILDDRRIVDPLELRRHVELGIDGVVRERQELRVPRLRDRSSLALKASSLVARSAAIRVA